MFSLIGGASALAAAAAAWRGARLSTGADPPAAPVAITVEVAHEPGVPRHQIPEELLREVGGRMGVRLTRKPGGDAKLVVTFMDAARHRAVLDRACPKEADCSLYNYAVMGPVSPGAFQVYLNARSWGMPSGTFGNPAAPLSQRDYRSLLLEHEFGHALFQEDHPTEAECALPDGSCSPMVQNSTTTARWFMPCVPRIRGGSSAMGDERAGPVAAPLGPKGQMTRDFEGRALMRIPTFGRGNCLIEAVVLAIATRRGGGLTFDEATATEAKSLAALRQITAEDALRFRANLVARAKRLYAESGRFRAWLQSTHSQAQIDDFLEKYEVTRGKDGRPDATASQTWLFDETIALTQHLIGIQLLFINKQQGTVFCRRAPQGLEAIEDDGSVQRARPLTVIILWEHGRHFTLLGLAEDGGEGAQTVFPSDGPLVARLLGNMKCGFSDVASPLRAY